MNTNEYDAALGERLTSALRAEAEHVPVPGGAWERFAARTETGSAIVIEPDAPAPAVSAPSARQHPWRIPLIAAAAVVGLVVATSAIVTNGFGGDDSAHPAAVGDASTPVRIPVNAAYRAFVLESNSGSAPASSELDVPPTGAPASRASHGNGYSSVSVSFPHGGPPDGVMQSRIELFNGQISPPIDNTPDGTPLGYVTRFTGITGDAPGATPWSNTLVLGVVGPDVARIEISSNIPGAGNDGGAAGAGTLMARWDFVGHGNAGAGDAGAEAFTPVAGGWQGFAVSLPVDANWVSIAASTAAGEILQGRRVDLNTGTTTDQPASPSSASATPPFTTSTATSAPPLGTTATGSHDSAGTTSPGYTPAGQNAPSSLVTTTPTGSSDTTGMSSPGNAPSSSVPDPAMATTAPSHTPATGRSAPAG